MKIRLGILIFLIQIFVAAPTNRVLACGNLDAEHAAKFHHSHDSTNHHHENVESKNHAHAQNHCEENHPDEPCSDDKKGHCHCPGCGTVFHAPAAFPAVEIAVFSPSIFTTSIKRQAFYFADHLPEAVHLPIWQPPKLSV